MEAKCYFCGKPTPTGGKCIHCGKPAPGPDFIIR